LIRYLPFEAGPHRLAMGIKPLDLANWLEVDADFTVYLDAKKQLLTNRHADVFAEVEGSRPAQAELLAALVENMSQFHPDIVIDLDDDLAPLDQAGRLVQEDFCLMEDDGDGIYQLTAASLCFPTRWLLADKIGRSMEAIHEPVPGYDERLGTPMEKFFVAMQVDNPVWRTNWSLVDSPELHLAIRYGQTKLNAEITHENVGQNVWLRVERQTLRRLPKTKAIVFTIKVYRHTLAEVTREPGAAAQLLAAVKALPEATRQYKSILPFEMAMLRYLESYAQTP